MSRNSIRIDYDMDYSGNYIVLLDGKEYCKALDWEDYKRIRNELLSQDLLLLCQ